MIAPIVGETLMGEAGLYRQGIGMVQLEEIERVITDGIGSGNLSFGIIRATSEEIFRSSQWPLYRSLTDEQDFAGIGTLGGIRVAGHDSLDIIRADTPKGRLITERRVLAFNGLSEAAYRGEQALPIIRRAMASCVS